MTLIFFLVVGLTKERKKNTDAAIKAIVPIKNVKLTKSVGTSPIKLNVLKISILFKIKLLVSFQI